MAIKEQVVYKILRNFPNQRFGYFSTTFEPETLESQSNSLKTCIIA